MKHVTAWLGVLSMVLVLTPRVWANDTFDVTIQVDMTAAIEACQFDPANETHKVQIRGTVPGTTWENDAAAMTRVDNTNVWRITLPVAAGNYEYKFVLLKGEAATWESVDNRALNVTAAVTLEPVPFGGTFANICEGAGAQSVNFSVDMGDAIDKCRLTPGQHTVSMAGDFNGWSTTATPLSPREGSPRIYEVTLDLPAGPINYKFFLSPDAWEDDPNRAYTVSTDANQTVQTVTFRKALDDACGAQPRQVEIEFAVDMEVWINGGDFDPAENIVVVAGSFNGWSTTTDTLRADFFNPNIYSKIVRLEQLLVPSDVMFKFVTGDATGDVNPGGWEGISDRRLRVTGEEDVVDGYLQVRFEEIPYFNNVTLDDVFTSEGGATLRLEVDARTAYYHLLDYGFVPSDVQTSEEVTSFSTVFINGPMSKTANDPVDNWATWGPENLGQIEARRFTWNAEDSLFVWERTFRQYQPRRWVFKLGLDGYDNENGFGADHNLVIDDVANPTVRIVFGATKTDATAGDLVPNEFGYRVDLYGRYIEFTPEGQPFVVRGGGVSVEPTYGELPASVTLSANYPNPFNPSTMFEYAIGTTQHVRVKVFDALGREVATLVDGVQTANTYQVTFDASALPSGVYLYQVQAGSQVVTRKMMLVK
jgi:hypothetical protein